MRFKVSQEANHDLREIGRYTQKKWGKNQRRKYLTELDEKFALLADNPHLGRACDSIREDYFRFEYIRHTIFYKQEKDFVLISRIIHKSRDIKTLLSQEG